MKKLFALLISAFLLVALFAIPASAEDEAIFWVTHYNDGSVEGAGSIFTDADAAGAWWHHVAFAPVEGKDNVYEIVEICYGDGNAYALSIPEGGFVYAINTGNNWPKLFADNGATGDGSTGLWFDDADHAAMPDYTSDSCAAAFAEIYGWTTGLTIKISGLNLAEKEIPTTTSDLGWYEDDYVCTATFAPYDGEDETEDPATSEGETGSDDTSEDATVSEDNATSEGEAVSENDAASENDAVSEGEAASVDEAASEEASEPADEAEGGLSTGALIAIIAASVVVVGVIVLVVVKSKK
ncbi:MAG: hypothetical protein IKU30_05975 [Clostridia bacterium]|nr:hypothetical protein [Clostridia bacterium]